MEAHWASADPADLHGFVIGFVAALEMTMELPDPLPPPLESAARILVTERQWRVDVPAGVVGAAPFLHLVVIGGWSGAFDARCEEHPLGKDGGSKMRSPCARHRHTKKQTT